MLDAKFQPITSWPRRPTRPQKSATYRAKYKQTLDLLERELRAVGAKQITIEAFFTPPQIRNDGWPRADARPSQPGVVLHFQTRRGPMIFPSDKFNSWEDNLRAIGLTLEALRAVERHGATFDGQQYTGWAALPKSKGDDELRLAASVLLKAAEWAERTIKKESFDRIWKAAVMKAHPDQGGSNERFNEVIAARDLIREKMGW